MGSNIADRAYKIDSLGWNGDIADVVSANVAEIIERLIMKNSSHISPVKRPKVFNDAWVEATFLGPQIPDKEGEAGPLTIGYSTPAGTGTLNIGPMVLDGIRHEFPETSATGQHTTIVRWVLEGDTLTHSIGA